MRTTKNNALMIVGIVLIALAALALPSVAAAQGCALCYQSAAASGPG